MWKVKRMNRARIIVLTNAIGAGGVAAYLASGSDSKPTSPIEPVAQPQTASNAFIRRSDRPEAIKEINGSIARFPFDDRPGQRGNINVVRYGVTSSMAVQK